MAVLSEEQKEAIGLLEMQAPSFRWVVDGTIILTRDQLIAEVKAGSEEITKLVLSQPGLGASEKEKKPALGRRYLCLVCGTQVLYTKADDGSGNPAECCDQEMTLQVPRNIPSSD